MTGSLTGTILGCRLVPGLGLGLAACRVGVSALQGQRVTKEHSRQARVPGQLHAVSRGM